MALEKRTTFPSMVAHGRRFASAGRGPVPGIHLQGSHRGRDPIVALRTNLGRAPPCTVRIPIQPSVIDFGYRLEACEVACSGRRCNGLVTPWQTSRH